MKYLRSVKVAGITYEVVEKPFIEIDCSRDYQGCCSYTNAEIAVLQDLVPERKEQIITHELTHAIFYEAGYDEQDEEMVDRVSKVLHQVLKDNF